MFLQSVVRRVLKPYQQFGALPFRWSSGGSLKVMLVTTRGRKRWMIPKGWPIPGLEPHESAAREAFEEAGLVGDPDPKDRKSTRLNSSHANISYAVFCLKKKRTHLKGFLACLFFALNLNLNV